MSAVSEQTQVLTGAQLSELKVQRLTVLRLRSSKPNPLTREQGMPVLRSLRAKTFRWDEGYGAWCLEARQSRTYRTVMVYLERDE